MLQPTPIGPTYVKGEERATRGVGKAHFIKGPRTNLPSDWKIFIAFTLPTQPLHQIPRQTYLHSPPSLCAEFGATGNKRCLINVNKVAS